MPQFTAARQAEIVGAANAARAQAAGERYPIWEKRIVGAGETAGSQIRTLRTTYEA